MHDRAKQGLSAYTQSNLSDCSQPRQASSFAGTGKVVAPGSEMAVVSLSCVWKTSADYRKVCDIGLEPSPTLPSRKPP